MYYTEKSTEKPESKLLALTHQITTNKPPSYYCVYLAGLQLPLCKFTETDWMTLSLRSQTALRFCFLSLDQSQTKSYSQEHLKLKCITFSYYFTRILQVPIKTNLKYTHFTINSLIFTVGVCFSKARPQF